MKHISPVILAFQKRRSGHSRAGGNPDLKGMTSQKRIAYSIRAVAQIALLLLVAFFLLTPAFVQAEEATTDAKIPTFEELCPNGLQKPSSEQEQRLEAHEDLLIPDIAVLV
jgi:hypothetical protein